MSRSAKLIALSALLLIMALSACGPTTTPSPPTIPPTAAPTDTPVPTNTPAPTRTPKPTNTPRPTDTPRPTLTPTPTPAPILLSGSGDSVVDLQKWQGPALVHITYTGSRNFVVWNYGVDGEKIGLLVNTIGNYEGTRPLDFLSNEHTTRFQIKASGQWKIQVLPLSEIRRENIPGTFKGKGDDVVLLVGKNPDLLKADASKAKSNFIIWGYGDRRNLLVNEIAPYKGTVVIPKGTLVLVIEAEGDWSIEVTTK